MTFIRGEKVFKVTLPEKVWPNIQPDRVGSSKLPEPSWNFRLLSIYFFISLNDLLISLGQNRSARNSTRQGEIQQVDIGKLRVTSVKFGSYEQNIKEHIKHANLVRNSKGTSKAKLILHFFIGNMTWTCILVLQQGAPSNCATSFYYSTKSTWVSFEQLPWFGTVTWCKRNQGHISDVTY